jgi:hypothetical protein
MAEQYQTLLDSLMNIAPNADDTAKKNVLRSVVKTILDGNFADQNLKSSAAVTNISLEFMPQDADIGVWITDEINMFKSELEARIQDPNRGGRRKRRSGKTKKTKKSRRYTRRR